ncbi:hypothetical protein O181_063679 [Austropuccinia psidii MF-1]|uniref:Uncharacterized protein n=1 Tax=Austropuccinia psidii MF-1 TaxID=1389203 RepID=A0A9Q3EML3_9BASI|nr:hypothetical protein [Austropuccinia psidii MF-1]
MVLPSSLACSYWCMRRLLPHRLVISPLYHAYSHACVASASPPNPLRPLACLRAHTPLQMRLQHRSPIYALTNTYVSSLSTCDSKPEHKHDSQNTINQWYSHDTTKT